MRIGLLGGTFDPVHLGHLDVARAARRALGLDVVWLVPSRLPPHRRRPAATSAHRFAMVAMAVAGEPGFLVSDIEMDTLGPSYTSDTLDRLEALGLDLRSIFFVAGADAFREISTWRAYPDLLDRCHFVAVSRPGTPAPSLRTWLPEAARRMIEAPCDVPSEPSIFLVDVSTAPVSSTDVRRACATGDSLVGLVPPTVAAHIVRHGLYGTRPDHTPASEGAE